MVCCTLKKSDSGASTSLYLSRLPFSELRSGEYYDDDNSHKEMDKKGRDMALVDKLWQMSGKAYGIKFD